MIHTIVEAVVGACAMSALGFAAYAVREVLTIEKVREDVSYIRSRVDNLYDLLAGKGVDPR